MEFLFGLIAIVGLGAIFYVTVNKKTRNELSDHIKAAEVVITEVQQELQHVEETANKLAVKAEKVVEEVVAEVKEVATKIKKVKVAAPKSAATKTAKTTAKSKATAKPKASNSAGKKKVKPS